MTMMTKPRRSYPTTSSSKCLLFLWTFCLTALRVPLISYKWSSSSSSSGGSIILLGVVADQSSSNEEQGNNNRNHHHQRNKNKNKNNSSKIAIIGGGISGSFVTKYLADYEYKYKYNSDSDNSNNNDNNNDHHCSGNSRYSLDITIFDPHHISMDGDGDGEYGDGDGDGEGDGEGEGEGGKNETKTDSFLQGSRVSSHTLPDGTVVERGASIIFGGNKLVNEMIDGTITRNESTSSNDNDNSTPVDELIRVQPQGSDAGSGGMAIYNGRVEQGLPSNLNDNNNPNVNQSSSPSSSSLSLSSSLPSFPLFFPNEMTSEDKKSAMIWRYNLDLYKINQATEQTIASFNRIYTLLLDNDDNDNDNNNDDNNNNNNYSEDEILQSPNTIWKYVGLSEVATMSFDDYLDTQLGVSSRISWWKKYVLEPVLRVFLYLGVFGNSHHNNSSSSSSSNSHQQGIVRTELYEPMNICNNNQLNSQMTGTYSS